MTRVQDLRTALLELHKELLEAQRIMAERWGGRMTSGEVLQAAADDLRFDWLRTISQLIAELDEAAQDEDAPHRVGEVVTRARALFAPPDETTAFGTRYLQALQDHPGVVLAHRDVVAALEAQAPRRTRSMSPAPRSGPLSMKPTNTESLWPRLAGLPLIVESCAYERLNAVLADEFQRVTTHVRLTGGGADGLGEDVSIHVEDGSSLHERRPALPLAGEWTLAAFCEHVATLELWPAPPEYDGALRFRRWAFESAALDLALRQAGRALHDVLGLEPRPVRFVNSLGLGKEPSIEHVRRRIARSPGVRFKLDAEATWSAALVEEVASTGAVDTIDFKGHYGFEVQDPEALGALYDRVIEAFPDAYLEDPHDLPEIARRLAGHVERVAYDAPIRTAEDLDATPLPARVVNVKPSRIGSLRALFEVYARCAREQRPMYGGGMGELGVGRGQIELLASLFHADAPNDVAPSAYNEDDPAGELPTSPLTPRPDATGFRWGSV